jgi:hypothetical protein
MTSDNKKAKADPAPKAEAPAKDKSTPGEAVAKTESKTESKTGSETAGGEPAAAASKTEGAAPAAAAPSSYSRGEGQKPVSAAYKENWNAIFANKNVKKKTTKKKNVKKANATKKSAKKKSAKKTKR